MCCEANILNRLRTKGRGRTGLIEWQSIPENFRETIKKAKGDPFAEASVKDFISRLEHDEAAAAHFAKAQLSEQKQLQHYVEAQILNLYGQLLEEIYAKKARQRGFKVTDQKRKLSKIINELKLITYPDSDTQKYPHDLPPNWRALERKYDRYKENSYAGLIHAGKDNANSKKIKGENADWILATYCHPNKPNTHVVHTKYMQLRQEKKWPALTEQAIYQWLQKTPQKKVWVLARHGKDEYIRLFGHQISRDKSDWFPYCYLGIDGTKLDWIHYKEGGAYNMGADIKINVIFDVYSEKIVGWDFTDREDHQSHFRAWKMAMQETGCKPLLITYDNQSGHKMETMQDLYDRLVTSNEGQHYPHRAYEHGSPVEQLFSRFQQQVLNTLWFSDKQAVTVRKADSKPNMEFIKRHRHKLKNPTDLKTNFEYCVAKWNNATHPHFQEEKATRNTVARKEQTYLLDKVTELDMMSLFWVTTKEPRTYEKDGIRTEISKKKYHFEVYDADGHVDVDFRDKYTGCKFYTQYDPDELDNYVRLHLKLPNGDTKYIADAQPVKKVKTLPPLMTDRDKGRMHKMTGVRDKDLERIEKQLEALRHRTNITEESLIEEQELELKFKGHIPKERRAVAEAGAGSWTSKL